MDKYLITDGTRYISKQKNGQYVADNNMNKALVLPRNEAEKVLKNNLSRAFRKIFRLQKTDKEIVTTTPPEAEDVMLAERLKLEEQIYAITEVEESECAMDEEYLTDLTSVMMAAEKYLTPTGDVSTVATMPEKDIREDISTDSVAAVKSMEEPEIIEPVPIKKKVKRETKHYDTPIKQNEQFVSDMKMMAGYFRDAASRKKQIEEKLDHIEKEIVDIRHYIEFRSLNACDGYNAYKMLRQRLIARRECKNELRIMEVLTAGVFTAKDIANIENIVDSFDTVVYKPRVLTSLFEEKEKSV